MAQLLPMSEEMIASTGNAAWIARQAWRGDMRSASRLRARSFQVVPGSSSSWSIEASVCSQRDLVSARLAALVARLGRELRQDLLGHLFGVALDADAHLLGETDAVGVDVDLDDRRVLRPVVDAVTGQRREGVEPRAQRQHHVGLG